MSEVTWSNWDGPPITFEKLRDMRRAIERPSMFPLQVIVMPDPVIFVPARRHPRKKRRLQKKWLARYGYKAIVDPKVDLLQVIHDTQHNVLYCYRAGRTAILQFMLNYNERARQKVEWQENRGDVVIHPPISSPFPLITIEDLKSS